MDDVAAAKILIKSLDLTSLKQSDTEDNIRSLCERAQTPFGNVAAVCIYPHFIRLAKSLLPKDIKIATVINFPAGLADEHLAEKEINAAIKYGADELDVVLPYRVLLSGDAEYCRKYLATVRKCCGNKVFKLIIESGELKSVENIVAAAQLGIEANADFIKTSTGKTEVSATPEAANLILETIAKNGGKTGFKASGGIKTLNDAKKYLVLAQAILRPEWIAVNHFRIGASSVLDDLLVTVNRGF